MEGCTTATGMELLTGLLEVVRAWVLHVSVYAHLESLLPVLGLVLTSALTGGREVAKR